MAAPPYISARLVNGDKALSARWYIQFSAWNADKGKLERHRDYEINQYKTVAKRKDFARRRINEINKYLSDGFHVSTKGRAKEKVQIAIQQDKDFTIDQAIRFIMPVVKQTKRPETFTSYNSVAGLFLKFCELAGWDQWKIRTLEQPDILAFLDYIQVTGTGDIGHKKEGTTVSNTTRNNYKTALSALFTLMVDRKILAVNVVKGIKELREDEPGNTAFTQEEIEVLKPAINAVSKRLWLFITFMIYGFIRPGEIGRLRVKMIDLDKNIIEMPGSITKNRKSRRVRIGKPFRACIDSLGLEKLHPNDLIFGRDLQSGSMAIQKNLSGNIHREILRDLGFGEGYSLYSWKTTGVILHYKAGIDIKTLQAQIGHQSLHETDVYLRSLGLFVNTEFEDKSPVI